MTSERSFRAPESDLLFFPARLDEDGKPVGFEGLLAVEIKLLLNELEDIFQGFFGIREAGFLQGSLDLGLRVTVDQHGDEQFFVVFVDTFPAFG